MNGILTDNDGNKYRFRSGKKAMDRIMDNEIKAWHFDKAVAYVKETMPIDNEGMCHVKGSVGELVRILMGRES